MRWTSLASPYPVELCRVYCEYVSSDVSRITDHAPQAATSVNFELKAAQRVLIGDTAVDYTHVDDTLALASSERVAVRHINELAHRARTKGFSIGEVNTAGDIEPFIGYSVRQSGRISPSPARAQLIHSAVTELLRQPRVKVRDVASIVGVLAWLFLLRRCLFAVFASSYAFLRKPLEAVLPLWPSVRRELRHARNLIPLAFLDLTWRAHPVVLAQDAQGATEGDNGGAGLVMAVPPPMEVLEGILCRPRGSAGPAAPDLRRELKGWLPPESARAVLVGNWHWWDFMAATWRAADHINAGEIRATLLWLEVLARSPECRHLRVLLLSDSTVAIGAMSKGRSSSFPLNRLLRRRMALEAAGGFTTTLRWVTSKVMPADRLSRERRVKGPIVGLFRKARRDRFRTSQIRGVSKR